MHGDIFATRVSDIHMYILMVLIVQNGKIVSLSPQQFKKKQLSSSFRPYKCIREQYLTFLLNVKNLRRDDI